MRIPSSSPLLLAAIGLLLLPASVQAQGVIGGQINDAGGVGLPGVSVDAIGVAAFDDRTMMTVTGVTDETGHYQLDLPAGVYSVRFSAPGFGTVIEESIGIEEDCRVEVDARLWTTDLREGVDLAGVHPYAAPSSLADRLPPVRRVTRTPGTHLWDSAVTPLVERTPRSDRWGETVERQLFSHHIKDACLGYAPMWLSHLDLVLRQRPCQVAWVRVPGVGVGS